MKSKEALELEQEQLEIEPSLSNLTSLESATKEQMAKLFEQINADEEQAGIQAEALRRLKVRQLSSGQLAPTPSSSPSQSNMPPQTE